jgi:hypothetical protein
LNRRAVRINQYGFLAGFLYDFHTGSRFHSQRKLDGFLGHGELLIGRTRLLGRIHTALLGIHTALLGIHTALLGIRAIWRINIARLIRSGIVHSRRLRRILR